MSAEEEARATFKLDQENAHQDQVTRDTTAWELNVRNGAANAAQTEAAAAVLNAKAKAFSAVAALINCVTFLGVVAFLAWTLYLLIGLFR